MAQVFSVRLRAKAEPVFPNRCILSGEENPNSKEKISANASGPFIAILFPLLMLFQHRRFFFFFMRKYKWKHYIQFIVRDFVPIIVVINVGYHLSPLFLKNDPFGKYKLMGLALLAISPWVIFNNWFPRKFDINAKDEWVEYEFLSKDYAEEFAKLNSENLLGLFVS